MKGKFPHILYCLLTEHDWEYTDEYANCMGHVQADKICTRCLKAELGWTGPEVEIIEDVCDVTVPSRKQAYSDVGVGIMEVCQVNR